jgi:formyl-CoA transferase
MQWVFPKLSDTPGVRWLDPELGAHNEEIYGGLLGSPTQRSTGTAPQESSDAAVDR